MTYTAVALSCCQVIRGWGWGGRPPKLLIMLLLNPPQSITYMQSKAVWHNGRCQHVTAVMPPAGIYI
jgi:hypothetical protein